MSEAWPMSISKVAVIAACLCSAAPVFAQAPAGSSDEGMTLTVGERKLKLGIDFSFAGVLDNSLIETLGRERQIKVAFANLSAGMDVDDHMSFLIVLNPAEDGIVPKPYIPSPGDRRTYFFPNEPDGRGVSSDPNGIKDVDDYKYSGFDPIIQQGALRFANLDLHNQKKTYGAIIGRLLVPQGWGLDEPLWFTAKDMTHIQRINAQADNGMTLYYDVPRLRIDLAVITGNGNPYHDYGYFDFTTATEDKNSAVGAVITGRVRLPKLTFGGTYRKNFINSRIEDSISIQLSKHNDDALIGFAAFQPDPHVRIYGEAASYKWGLAQTSAELLPGPPNKTPVYKNGFYAGVDLWTSETKFGKWGLTFTQEILSRDDSLVAWAAANQLYGVTLGEWEKGTIFKGLVQVKQLAMYGFINLVSNPFPVLSAIVPVSGPGSAEDVSNTKVGFGVRFRL